MGILNKWVIVGIVFSVLIAGGYFYFSWSQNKLAELNQRLAQQEQQIAIQNATIDHINSRMATIEEANKQFNAEVRRIRSQTIELGKMYNRRLLDDTAVAEPVKVEQQINQMTQTLFEELEKLSRGGEK